VYDKQNAHEGEIIIHFSLHFQIPHQQFLTNLEPQRAKLSFTGHTLSTVTADGFYSCQLSLLWL
jgi:hypothetical protein